MQTTCKPLKSEVAMPGNDDEVKINLTNELAKERNRAAYDRTLMAWIRTAISLIGFGFAIAKSYEYVERDLLETSGRLLDTLHAPLWFGMSFILLGMMCILGGVIQYTKVVKQIQSDRFSYSESKPLAKIVALLLLIIGIFALITIFQRRILPLYGMASWMC
jgi:putative membrane protein